MSLDLDLVSQVMYLADGDVNPGDKEKVVRFEAKLSDWKRDVVDRLMANSSKSLPTREDMSFDFSKIENNFEGYWCEGEKCVSNRTHWVLHNSETLCWECRHDPCACCTPLVWDEMEGAYYGFFLSCDLKTKTNYWMTEPTSDLARIDFHRREKKRKILVEKELEQENCADNQQNARDEGFCCHHHAKKMKLEEQKEREANKRAKVDSPDHCILCGDDPCVFLQIETRLWANDEIYYDSEDYAKAPVACNSNRRKRAYQYAAHIIWGGINYRKEHYKCVVNGVRALFPPLDGKVMGFKNV